MKNLLNNLSEEEKNSIREQHTGGMNLDIKNFKGLVENKLGNVKPLINEQEQNIPLWRQVVTKVGDDKFTNIYDDGSAIIGNPDGKHIMVGKVNDDFGFSGRISDSPQPTSPDWGKVNELLNKLDQTKRTDKYREKYNDFKFYPLMVNDVDSVVVAINGLLPILGL